MERFRRRQELVRGSSVGAGVQLSSAGAVGQRKACGTKTANEPDTNICIVRQGDVCAPVGPLPSPAPSQPAPHPLTHQLYKHYDQQRAGQHGRREDAVTIKVVLCSKLLPVLRCQAVQPLRIVHHAHCRCAGEGILILSYSTSVGCCVTICVTFVAIKVCGCCHAVSAGRKLV